MNWFVFALSALACYRLSRMFALEDGPADAFKRMRDATNPKSNIGRGIRCPFCWSVHFGFWITGYLLLIEQVNLKIAPMYWMALSGIAVILNRWDGED